jgi:tetratricopeptide (TPR) repeat protein
MVTISRRGVATLSTGSRIARMLMRCVGLLHTVPFRLDPEERLERRGFNTRAASGRRWAMLAIAFWSAQAPALPYIPTSDSEVLERVAARSALDRLEPLRRTVAANPRDLSATLELAKGYLQLGRAAGDPRFVAYAQAALLPWLRDGNAPEPVLVLQATALQNQHQFAAAMKLLDRAVQLNPSDPQVWLTRATIYSLRNDLTNARSACARLTRTADTLVALTCLTEIDSRNGRLRPSFGALQSVFVDDARLPAELRVWILTQLSDMAERLGNDAAAEQYLQSALQAQPGDGFSLAAYADLLIRQRRYPEAIALLAGREAQDNLLLRLSIASQRSGSPEARRWSDMYAARTQAARRDGDIVHLREQAMFALDVDHDAARALRIAAQNWQQQREPADVRIYLRAARATRGSNVPGSSQDQLSQWLALTRYEDATLAPVQQ